MTSSPVVVVQEPFLYNAVDLTNYLFGDQERIFVIGKLAGARKFFHLPHTIMEVQVA